MPIRLERRPEVVNIHARKLRHQPVRAARWDPPHHEVVDALLAPARHHVVALFQLFQEVRNLVRIVLQIAVHRQDEIARRMIESSRQRRRLSEIAAQLYHQHTAVHRGNLFQQLVSLVARAVIDQHQLKAFAHLFHHLFQTRVQNGYIVFFIVERDDNRILRHTHSIDAP